MVLLLRRLAPPPDIRLPSSKVQEPLPFKPSRIAEPLVSAVTELNHIIIIVSRAFPRLLGGPANTNANCALLWLQYVAWKPMLIAQRMLKVFHNVNGGGHQEAKPRVRKWVSNQKGSSVG